MTLRARRMERFLSEHGWQTGSDKFTCKKCGHYEFGRTSFCRDCGAPMPKKADPSDTIEQLEEAIFYALKEKKEEK